MVIPAMRKPKGFDQAVWSQAVIECCRAFLSLGVEQLTLVSDSSMRNAALQFEKEPKFRFVELNYEPQGALATVCIGLASNESGRLGVGICPADTIVSESLGDEIDEFGNSGSKCLVMAFEIPEALADASWSYVHMVDHGADRIAVITEGAPSSPIATSGIFLFRDSETFLSAAQWCFVNQTTTNQQYFASSAVNYLIAREEKVDMKILAQSTFEKIGRERPSK